MIRLLTGPDLNVPQIPECYVVEWAEAGKRVVFSYAQQGNAITIHFACEKDALRDVKAAIVDFCEWAFWGYRWCEMIFAMIGRPSIERIAKKCGFVWLTQTNDLEIYVIQRNHRRIAL